MWNRVKIDNEWYYIDVTWMDYGNTVDYTYSLSKTLWNDHLEFGDMEDYIYDTGDGPGIISYL